MERAVTAVAMLASTVALLLGAPHAVAAGKASHDHEEGSHAHDSASGDVTEGVRNAIQTYVGDQRGFSIYDAQTRQRRKVVLTSLNHGVKESHTGYLMCADMRDINTEEILDVDFDVIDRGGRMIVTDMRIHTVNGKQRFTYDANGYRVPVTPDGSHHEGSRHEGSSSY